jgi:ribonuclease HI
MEMLGVVEALKAIPPGSSAVLYTDSKFIVDSINLRWVDKWKGNGWKKSGNHRVLNLDLWMQILELLSECEVEFQWIKGHNGNVENERCDSLALQAAAGKILGVDEGYERQAGRSGE